MHSVLPTPDFPPRGAIGQKFWLTKIDAATGRYAGRIRLGNPPQRFVLTPDGKQAFVRDRTKITAVHLATGATTSIADKRPVDEVLSPDGRTLYVASDDNVVAVIDTATDRVRGQVLLQGQDRAIAVSPDGRTVYVLGPNTVVVLDAATLAVTTTIPLPTPVPNVAGLGKVIPGVGATPLRIAVAPDGKHAYVTSDPDTLAVIDTRTNRVTRTITVGFDPIGVAISADSTRAFVANAFNDTVSVINTRSGLRARLEPDRRRRRGERATTPLGDVRVNGLAAH